MATAIFFLALSLYESILKAQDKWDHRTFMKEARSLPYWFLFFVAYDLISLAT